MLYSSTLTQKGQVTIPVQIRRLLGLLPYKKVMFTQIKGRVFLSPAKHFLDLKGSLKSHKRYSDKAADKAVLEYIKEEYAQK